MKVELINIIDRSGSIANIDSELCGGFNNFMDEQRRLPGEVRVTTVLFDDKFETIHRAADIREVAPLRSVGPRGMTALLDAIGKTVTEHEARINRESWADKVIVFIGTDGQENASVEWRVPGAIRQLLKRMQAFGWVFIFVGANQDAFVTAEQYGINQDYVMSFAATGAGATQAMGYASNATRAIRGTTF